MIDEYGLKIQKPKLSISYHEDKDILVIEGVHYSGDLFRTLSMPKPGKVYGFERTKDLPETLIVRSFGSIKDVEDYLNGD